jgi:uncharacterized repeat protein (TIGR03803 family)
VVYSLKGHDDGIGPAASLIDVSGVLYGTTMYGGGPSCDGSGCGSVFKLTRGGAETVLYSFYDFSNGKWPAASLLYRSGAFYGTTTADGAHRSGVLFSLTPAGVETRLHIFGGGSDGAFPSGALINVGGTLYGTTSNGGANGAGTVFAITP